MDSKQSKNESSEVAGRIYDVSDYKREDPLSSGLAQNPRTSLGYLCGRRDKGSH